MKPYPYALMTKEAREKNRLAHLEKYSSGVRKAVFKGEKRPQHSKIMKQKFENGEWKPPVMLNDDNPAWKGDKAGYSAIHKWLVNHKKKIGICVMCKKDKRTEYANVSGKYKRDVKDFIELCTSCHRTFDNRRKIVFEDLARLKPEEIK